MSESNTNPNTVELYGMKDGIQVHLGQAPMPARMKAKELVIDTFGRFDENDDMDDSDAALCFYCMTQLIDYMTKQERTQAAKIEELEKASQWQPIETAPKDGTTIIVGRPDIPTNNLHAVHMGCVGTAYYMDGDWVTPNDRMFVEALGDYVRYVDITQWKPLPQLPVIKGEQT